MQIKDLILGAKAADRDSDREEYLREAGRGAVFRCREDELVAKVREVLARHEVKWR